MDLNETSQWCCTTIIDMHEIVHACLILPRIWSLALPSSKLYTVWLVFLTFPTSLHGFEWNSRHLPTCSYSRDMHILISQNFSVDFVWLKITDKDPVPEMCIWSILLIKSDLKWWFKRLPVSAIVLNGLFSVGTCIVAFVIGLSQITSFLSQEVSFPM